MKQIINNRHPERSEGSLNVPPVILSETKDLATHTTDSSVTLFPQNDKILRNLERSERSHKTFRSFHSLQAEYGRSMVEMLGVLAIIGVISIGGIAGYNFAMKSYRTNEIINSATLLSVMGISQNGGSGTGSLECVTTLGSLPPETTAMTYASGVVNITIPDISYCQEVKKKIGTTGAISAGDCIEAEGGYALTLTYTNAGTPGTDEGETGGGTTGGSGEGEQLGEENTCPENFDTHNGCQSCSNGTISYKTAGAYCESHDGNSVCDGSGNCCSPDGNNSSTCCGLLEMHWTGTFCCESMGNWTGTFCCDGSWINNKCCNYFIDEECCENGNYEWDEGNNFCCSSTAWDYDYLQTCE